MYYKACKELAVIPESFSVVAQASLFSLGHVLPLQTNLPESLRRMQLVCYNLSFPCCVNMASQMLATC